MKKSLKLALTLSSFSLLATPAYAAFATNSNNDFASSTILTAGQLSFDGELSGIINIDNLVPDFYFQSQNLLAGSVNPYNVSDAGAGTPFYAVIDNSASDVDTQMGAFDEFDNQIAFNDDGGPFFESLGSALFSHANSDGSINLKVTGFNDIDFIGDHTQQGEYALSIFLDINASDLDFITFTGLIPGAQMFAEISSADFDSVLGWFDTDGSLINSNDDGGLGNLSKLAFNVSDNGTATFSVSGYPDFGFIGEHSQSGAYRLTLTAVPLPAAIWLFGSTLLGLLFYSRRNPSM